MHVRQAAGCPTGLFAAECNYVFALNPDGTCCAFILMQINAFANGLAGAVVTDIVGNVITTQDISTFLFPNVFLYFGNARQSCVLEFHTYSFQPGSDLERLGDKLLKLDHTRPARAQLPGPYCCEPRNRRDL